MEVKQIREEIAKIDSMLTIIDTEMAECRLVDDEEIVRSEYMSILNSLASSSDSSNLDAFTYFGLIQAFSEDTIVMKCLSDMFTSVQGVTMTQMQDFLLVIEKMTDPLGKCQLGIALLKKIHGLLIPSPTHSPLIDLARRACEMLNSTPPILVPGMEDLTIEFLSTLGGNISIGLKIEIQYLRHQLGLPRSQSSAHPSWSDIPTEPSVDIRSVWQLLVISKGGQEFDSFSESLVAASSIWSTQRSTDYHEFAKALCGGASPPGSSLWLTLIDKITSSGGSSPVYDVPGTFSALARGRVYSEKIFSNQALFRKRISSTVLGRRELKEIVDYLSMVGDKSQNSILTRAIIERRDLFVPPSVAATDHETLDLLISVLFLTVVASLESGSVIPESILLLKKFSPQILARAEELGGETAERIAMLFHGLLPGFDWTCWVTKTLPLGDLEISNRIEQTLKYHGFILENGILEKNFQVHGLHANFCLPSDKIAVIVEPHAITLAGTTKRTTITGTTAVRVNILATRKNFKVIVVIPEMYSQGDKQLIQLFADPLRKLNSMNFRLRVDGSMSGPTVLPDSGARIGVVEFFDATIVEIARFLFHVLKTQIYVGKFDFGGIADDQFLNMIFAEFLATYIVRQKGNLEIDLRGSMNVTLDGLGRVIESLGNTSSGGFGAIRILSDLPETETIKLIANAPTNVRINEGNSNCIYLG